MVDIVAVVDEGLGNSSYLVGLGEGRALVVDPSRDPGPYLAEAWRRTWTLAFAAETHLHADFVSGSFELAAAAPVTVLASAEAGLSGPHRRLGDGEEVDLGGLTLRALCTPGHTPEHLAYLLLDGKEAVAVFTGGTLIVGGVARPDLLGDEHTRPLARAAYRSLHERLLALPDDLPVYPTHGAGSFCSSGHGDARVSTIGRERASNPLVAVADEGRFVERLLGELGSYPPYFLRLRAVNQAGAPLHGPVTGAELPRLSTAQLDIAVDEGAVLVDARPLAAFAAAHLPGSISNVLRPQFASWLGWLIDRDRPLVFVLDGGTDRAELVRQGRKVGFEHLIGELAGGITTWRSEGRALASIPLVTPEGLGGTETLLDVRQDAEWAAGHLPRATHIELGRLTDAVTGELPAHASLVVHCGHGERAMTAASLLTARGRRDVRVLAGGPDQIAATTGRPLATGP